MTFYVKNPGQTTSVSADIIQNILSQGFTTDLKLTIINVEASSLTAPTNPDDLNSIEVQLYNFDVNEVCKL